ncbi:hypothetical protein LLH00_04205 [bacterium]|nr:hypothetical protein [bacterium]
MKTRLTFLLAVCLVAFGFAPTIRAAASPDEISLDGAWRMKDFVIGMGMWKPSLAITLVDPPPDTAQLTGGALCAQVPGSVQHNLFALGRVPDPYVEQNCDSLKWVEDREWWFTRTVDIPEAWRGRRVALKCNLINYRADVWVNQTWCGVTVGDYQPLDIEVQKGLQFGRSNVVAIRLRAPENSSKAIPDLKFIDWHTMDGSLHKRPHVTPTNPQAGEFLMSKCFFGWDWGPHLVPLGILQPIRLVASDFLSLDNLFVRTVELDGGGAAARLAVDFNLRNESDRTRTAELRYSVRPGGRESVALERTLAVSVPAGGRLCLSDTFSLERPELWWPLPLGGQPLYRIEAALVDESGAMLSRAQERFGVRTLRMVRNEESDAPVTSIYQRRVDPELEGGRYDWTFEINGRKVFCQGMNWIPVDAMLDLAPERYEYLLRLAAGAGVNMFRVWGEGLYETDTFYDLCDSLGILVWQDFWVGSFSNAQPQDLSWQAVEANIVRTRNHPSLVLYCGGNEFDATRSDRLWQIEHLRELCRRYDGTRQFHKSSPHGGDVHGGMGILPTAGRAARYGSFVSEGGYQQSWPPRSDMLKFLKEDELFPIEPNTVPLAFHNVELIADVHGNDSLYGVPRNLDELIRIEMLNNVIGWQSQLENTRLERFKVSGCLFWAMNDVWPTTSWSMVDWYGTCKNHYYTFKRSGLPLQVIASQQYAVLKPGEPYNLDICLVNDNLQAMNGLKVTAGIYLGEKAARVYSKAFSGSVGAYGAACLGKLDWTVPTGSPEHNFLLRLEVFDAQGLFLVRNEYTGLIGDADRHSVSGGFFGEYGRWAKNGIQPALAQLPKSLARGEEKQFEITYVNRGPNAIMGLETLVTDLPEGVRFYLDDNYINLLPGEKRTLRASLQVTGRAADLSGLELNLQTDGWNVERSARKLLIGLK